MPRASEAAFAVPFVAGTRMAGAWSLPGAMRQAPPTTLPAAVSPTGVKPSSALVVESWIVTGFVSVAESFSFRCQTPV